MADNYLGNKMDDYRAGRLRSGAPRRVTPSGRKPGALSLPVRLDFPLWIPQGALLPAGLSLIEDLVNAGLKVAYRAERSAEGAAPALRLGARHYPPEADAPAADSVAEIADDSIIIDSGRVRIDFSPADARSAAALAATFLSLDGLKVTSAHLII